MNKAELVRRVARDTGLSKADALRVLDAVVAQITRSLRRGEPVKLVDFGTFLVGHRRSRAAHNPHTGEAMAFGLMSAIPLLLFHARLTTTTGQIVNSLEMASLKALNSISNFSKRQFDSAPSVLKAN